MADNQALSMASGTDNTEIDWEILVKGAQVWISWPGQNDSKNLGPTETVAEAMCSFLGQIDFGCDWKPPV